MSAEIARLERTEQGLSEDDLRIATAIVYARFRGVFSSITKDHLQEGNVALVIWGAQNDRPLFRIVRWDGQYVAVDESTGKVLAADRLEHLLEALREQYPPMSAL